MCGIISAFGKNPSKHVREQYTKQFNRGEDGFGFIALKNNRIVYKARCAHESLIWAELAAADVREPDAILFHHRFPTSTINVPEAAHPLPIMQSSYRHNYYVLHNGVISEADKEVREIEKTGYTFASRVTEVTMYRAGGVMYEVTGNSDVNDSEVLGYYIAEFLEGNRKDIPVGGPIAAITLQENKKTGHCNVFIMRNYGNPLQVKRDKDAGVLLIASEANGVMVPAQKIHKLTRKHALATVTNVMIGSGFGYPIDFEDRNWATSSGGSEGRASHNGAYESDGQGGWRKIGYNPDKSPKPEARRDTSTNDANALNPVIEQAIETAQLAADLAYTDYQEALRFGDMPLTESERADVEMYCEELRATWVEREEQYEDLLEENGKEYDYARNRDGAEAISG